MRDLLNRLFVESQAADSGEFVCLESMHEKLLEGDVKSVESKKKPLESALKSFGVTGSVELDPSGLALFVDDGEVYNGILNLLSQADNMHELAEMGWVASPSGENTMNNEEPQFRVRFIEVTTIKPSSSDKPENLETIAKAAIEFATTPMDRDDDMNPVDNDPKAKMGSKDAGVGKAKDGEKAKKSMKEAEELFDRLISEEVDAGNEDTDPEDAEAGTFKVKVDTVSQNEPGEGEVE